MASLVRFVRTGTLMHKARILIVDDEPKICEFLQVLLRREGYDVPAVHRADDAIRQVEQDRLDLVVTDLRMPGMDGFELVTRLKAIRKDLPVVMITGYATVETAVKALRYGVDDYVTKPFNIEELRRVISRVIQANRMEIDKREMLDQLQSARDELDRQRQTLAEQSSRLANPAPPPEAPVPPVDSVAGDLEVFRLLGRLAVGDEDVARPLGRAARALQEAFGVRLVSIMLRESDALVVRATEGARDGALLACRQPLYQGVAGCVAREQRPLLVAGEASAPSLPRAADRGYPDGSFLCVPIVRDGRTLGLINLTGKAAGPLNSDDLARAVRAADLLAPLIENCAAHRAHEERCLTVVQDLARMGEARNGGALGHAERVAKYAVALARAAGVGPGEMEILRRAARLHDVGAFALDDRLANKPTPLTPDERQAMQGHPVAADRLLQPMEFLGAVRRVIRHHHERVDGQGYPDRLRGQGIPRLARILAVAEAYDALTSDRPYRTALSRQDAVRELQTQAGRQFDEELVRLFCETVSPQDRRE